MYGLMLCELYKFPVNLMPVCINCSSLSALLKPQVFALFLYHSTLDKASPHEAAQQCLNVTDWLGAMFITSHYIASPHCVIWCELAIRIICQTLAIQTL